MVIALSPLLHLSCGTDDIRETIKCSENLNSFKRNLKTSLFKRYFNV